VRGAVGAAAVLVAAFIGAGIWLRYGGIEGFVITSVVDPAALPDPLAKTVVRSADAWWANYAAQPLLYALPVLGVVGALVAAVHQMCTAFGLVLNTGGDVPAEAAAKAAALDAARAAKDFATADALRAELQADGWTVETTKAGTTLRR